MRKATALDIDEYNRQYLINEMTAVGIEDSDDQIRFAGWFEKIIHHLPLEVVEEIAGSFFPDIQDSIGECQFCWRLFTPGEDGNELGICAKCSTSHDFPYDIDAYYRDCDDGKVAFKGWDTYARGMLAPYEKERIVRIRCKIRDKTTDEMLYWSNRDGWVDRGSATIFTKDEVQSFNIPLDGEWVNGYDDKI